MKSKCSLLWFFFVCFLFAGSQRNVCYKVTSSRCSADIHYDKTFVPLEDQRTSDFTILQPIIDSKCSPDIERYLCFARLPPCTADTSVVHLPCQELCERIDRDCGSTFEKKKIPPLHCDYLFPQGDSVSGLCNLTQWPAPWPWKIPERLPPTSGKEKRGKTCISLAIKGFFFSYIKTKNSQSEYKMSFNSTLAVPSKPKRSQQNIFSTECYYCWIIILLWIVELKLLGLELKANTSSFKVQSLFKNTLIQKERNTLSQK